MPLPIFISSYSKDTPYQEIVNNLISSLKKWGLDFDIESFESLGTWRANSNRTARQVQRALSRHFPRSILRLDADAIVQQYPILLENLDCDFAACIWSRFRRELLGGTLYFANNDITRELVDKWVEFCEHRPNARNPDLLDEAMGQFPRLKFQRLPLGYCCIFDLMRKEVKEQDKYIVHYQASRKNKIIINSLGKKS